MPIDLDYDQFDELSATYLKAHDEVLNIIQIHAIQRAKIETLVFKA
jgi:hypothetical protein